MRTVTDYLTDPAHGLVREARPPQIIMANSIEEVLRDGGAYFCEAPVATGKTYAYLLPALLAAGRRVVVATAKKGLQDQIVGKDFPTLKRVLNQPSATAIPLKGKGNYACELSAMTILAKNPDDGAPYMDFLRRNLYGDRAEYPGMPPRWWGSASAEDCVGKRCDYFDNCGYVRLKRDVSQSKLIVINHHVLGAEMYFGHGKLVGGPYDVLIIDEAHTLAAGIRSAFTHRVSEDSITALNDLLKRTSSTFPSIGKLLEPWKAMFEAVPNRHYQEANAKEIPVFQPVLALAAIDGLRALAVELAKSTEVFSKEDESEEPREYAPIDDGLSEFDEEMRGIEVDLAHEAVRKEEGNARDLAFLAQATRRVDSLLRGLQTAQGVVDPDLEVTNPEEQAMRRERILANTAIYATQDDRGRFGINCAPVSVGGIAGKYFSAIKTIVVCSATLAVNDAFDHVTSMTGLSPAKAEVLPTSFNYDAQGFVFVPRELPAIGRNNPDYAVVMQRRVDMAVKLVELSDGGAFILTTANDELDAFAVALKQRFPGRTFVQGHRKNPWDGDPNAALKLFKATPDSILVGSKSFWEGVDVPGGALRLVIMAKLPFPQFNDPIIKARERLAGKDAFRDVQMVDMLIDLRQGVGRLIRSKDDRGCVAILDSRIWDKTYGGAVRRALPWSNAAITSDMKVCERFIPRFVAHFRRTPAA
jgi:Rad3-related DNA helicase